MNHNSRKLFEKAQLLMPGGVNSPVRAFKAVGGDPLFIDHGRGAYLTDVDGNQYIDFVCSWGPLILGHAYPKIVATLQKTAKRGTSYGAPTEAEVNFARLICQSVPSIERVRLVNSGTEATMSAIRLARAFTERDRVIKFTGCYHGHADSLLVKAGSGVVSLALPDSPGVPRGFAANTISLPFNDLQSVLDAIDSNPEQIACIIVEPVAGNMGVVAPQAGYLEGLRQIATEYNIVLIFDEVITGFRLGLGGAQKQFNVYPDLTCLGKIIGGGLPVGAYGGKQALMKLVAPEGPVYQAGTLSGNPLAVAAGAATLKILERPAVYRKLDALAAKLCDGISDAASKTGVKIKINRVGSMFTIFFTDREVFDYETAKKADTQQYSRFFGLMLESGVYLPPSQFEAMFVSLAHSNRDIGKTIQVAHKAFRQLASERASS